jgi:hypothetical protein
MRGYIAIALPLIAWPVWAAADSLFEGQATFMVGNRYCPVQGPALKFDIKADGTVAGDVKTQNKNVALNGTVAPDGKLTASYKGASDADVVKIEGTVTADRLEGFSQSASCRYKLSFTRQQPPQVGNAAPQR